MTPINYSKWGYIPIDDNPEITSVNSWNPPMIPNIALDDSSCIVFNLDSVPTLLNLSISTTAFSAPTNISAAFLIYSSETNKTFEMIPCLEWEKVPEGTFQTFSTQIKNPLNTIKILHKGSTVIVTGTSFEGA